MSVVLEQIDVTGCRIEGAISKELGHAGPKHHGLILGRSQFDGVIYIAEFYRTGYVIGRYQDFIQKYEVNGKIIVSANDGQYENVLVAQRALAEIQQRTNEQYDLLINNCECFVNRAMRGKSVSDQVINTAIGLLILAGLVYVVKNAR